MTECRTHIFVLVFQRIASCLEFVTVDAGSLCEFAKVMNNTKVNFFHQSCTTCSSALCLYFFFFNDSIVLPVLVLKG